MSATEQVLGLLALAMMAVTTGLLMWANMERKRIQRDRNYGLPRCRICRRVWDEHTNIGACPNGSGNFYMEE